MGQNWLCIDEGDGEHSFRDCNDDLGRCDAFSAKEEEQAEYTRLHDMLSRLREGSTRPAAKKRADPGFMETLNDVSRCLEVLKEATKTGYSVDGVVCAAFARKYGFALLDAEEGEDPLDDRPAEESIKECEERDAIQWNQPMYNPMDVKFKQPAEDKASPGLLNFEGPGYI